MSSALVNVVHAFTLSIVRDGQFVKERIEVGIQRLEDDIASHWYTKAHTAEVPAGKADAEVGAAVAPAKSKK